jgi:hypothetical protein
MSFVNGSHRWIRNNTVKTTHMIEVFKTDVREPEHAQLLVGEIRRHFSTLEVNFDLDDCDRILRVRSTDTVDASAIIELLKGFGYEAEVLSENSPAAPTITLPFLTC